MSIYKKMIIGISGFSSAIALLLIIEELNTKGTCPPFPLFGFPTCQLVFILYLLVFGSQFIKNKIMADRLFFTAAGVGLATAFWFSSQELLRFAECPEFSSIPLCYVALIGWGVLFWLKSKDKSPLQE